MLTRQALLDLHAAYAFAIDDGDAEGFADCFTRDGVLETTRPVVVSGREALVAFARARASSATDPARHMTWHHTFEEQAAQVNGRCSAAIFQTTHDGVSIVFTATYLDTFVQEAQEHPVWRLRKRLVLIARAGAVVPD